MGHVDHGKTSLLDYIQKPKVAARRSQWHYPAHRCVPRTRPAADDHLPGYPGHAAFTSMRYRGAKATDIVVLVYFAADDGVMPQTIQLSSTPRRPVLPLVVAVNKIDKPEADRIASRPSWPVTNVMSEDWGGDCQFVHVSAKSGEGIDDLLEAILIQAEVPGAESGG